MTVTRTRTPVAREEIASSARLNEKDLLTAVKRVQDWKRRRRGISVAHDVSRGDEQEIKLEPRQGRHNNYVAPAGAQGQRGTLIPTTYVVGY